MPSCSTAYGTSAPGSTLELIALLKWNVYATLMCLMVPLAHRGGFILLEFSLVRWL